MSPSSALADRFRQTMGQFCTGVVVVTGHNARGPQGFCAQSFVSLSLDPPLIAICPALTSLSWPRIRASGAFGINVLSADQQDLAARFARSGGDKFQALDWQAGYKHLPTLPGALAFIACDVEAEHTAGDHLIAVGRVRDLQIMDTTAAPLLFFRGQYREVAISPPRNSIPQQG
ncbi:MAG: flavin reductase family protein [Panacagrimonas sp.]